MAMNTEREILSFCTPPRGKSTRFRETCNNSPGSVSRKLSAVKNLHSSARKESLKTPDRFIPNRIGSNQEFGSHEVTKSVSKKGKKLDFTSNTNHSNDQLIKQIFCETQRLTSNHRILNFTPSKSKNDEYWYSYNSKAKAHSQLKRTSRKIPKVADKTLDAPNLLNDFYLNLLHWGKLNQLAIGIGSSVYLFNADNGKTVELCQSSNGSLPTALQWTINGTHLAVGFSDAELQLWDIKTCKLAHRMRSHNTRIGCLSWHPQHTDLVSSGSQTGDIHIYDVRTRHNPTPQIQPHLMDVCGLQWSPNGRFLASGGNDNIVNIWDMYSLEPWNNPITTFKEHKAAVKAISWCPWQSCLLATGGGTADKSIHIWNVLSGQINKSVETKSQISGLCWSSEYRELISSHGYAENHLAIWDPESFQTPLIKLEGHEGRILYMTQSPDGQVVATAAADETLRFWNCFTSTSLNKSERTRTFCVKENETGKFEEMLLFAR